MENQLSLIVNHLHFTPVGKLRPNHSLLNYNGYLCEKWFSLVPYENPLRLSREYLPKSYGGIHPKSYGQGQGA